MIQCGLRCWEQLTQEDKLGPEVDNAEKREVECYAIQERTDHTRRADILGRRVIRELGTWSNVACVVCAVWLFAGMPRWMIAEGLGPVCRILRRYHHRERIVDGEGDQS